MPRRAQISSASAGWARPLKTFSGPYKRADYSERMLRFGDPAIFHASLSHPDIDRDCCRRGAISPLACDAAVGAMAASRRRGGIPLTRDPRPDSLLDLVGTPADRARAAARERIVVLRPRRDRLLPYPPC